MFCGVTSDEVGAGRTAHALSGGAPRHTLPLFCLAQPHASDHDSTQDNKSTDTLDDPTRGARGQVTKARVLLVDDDEDVLAIMVPFLEDEGFEVITADNGSDALTRVRCDNPDVVILDLMMPVVSGWDVWDHMQQSPELAQIPVVIFTASGLGPGAFGARTPVVRKGASMEEILSALQGSLGAP